MTYTIDDLYLATTIAHKEAHELRIRGEDEGTVFGRCGTSTLCLKYVEWHGDYYTAIAVENTKEHAQYAVQVMLVAILFGSVPATGGIVTGPLYVLGEDN